MATAEGVLDGVRRLEEAVAAEAVANEVSECRERGERLRRGDVTGKFATLFEEGAVK